MSTRILRIKEVERLTGFHRQTIWRKTKAGTFPKPRKMGVLNVWTEQEITAWIADVLKEGGAVHHD